MSLLQSLAGRLFEVSFATGLVIAVLLLIRPILGKRYRSKTFYWIWLVAALRLAIPVNLPVFPAIININAPDTVLIRSAQPQAGDAAPSGIDRIVSPITTDGTDTKQTEALPPTENALTIGRLVSVIWISGAGIFFAGNLIAYLRFRRKIRRWSRAWTDSEGMELFEALKRETGVSNVSAALCCAVPSPLAIGFIRPTLLLSKEDYTYEELEAVLRHELIHIRRRDLWYKLLLLIARSLHWFNPIVHLMARRAEEDLEISCDEAVVSGKPISFQSQYGHAVLSAAEYDLKFSASLTTHFKGGKNTMKERMSAITGKNGRHKGSLIVILIAAAVTIAAAGCSLNSTNSSTSNDPVLIQTFTQEDVNITPEIPLVAFRSADGDVEINQLHGALPGASEGMWYIVMKDGVEYYYASYDDSLESPELLSYAIVSDDYSLANGISVGMTKDEVTKQYPNMAILDTQGNCLNDVTGHMGWNPTAYPRSIVVIGSDLTSTDKKQFFWEDQFDCIMIADVEQEEDSPPVYLALMIKDDKVAAITFYCPTAG